MSMVTCTHMFVDRTQITSNSSPINIMYIDIIISNFGYVCTRMFTVRERKAYQDSATKEKNVFCVLKVKQQVVPSKET